MELVLGSERKEWRRGWSTYNPITLDTLQRLNFLMFPQFLGIVNIVGGWNRNKILPPQPGQIRMSDSLVANGVEGRIGGLDGREKTSKVSYSALLRRTVSMVEEWTIPG